MELLSHGSGSSLLEHLEEVSQAGKSIEEKIICFCHDIGKATEAWQKYIRNPQKGQSPHYHAEAGGLLAAFAIEALYKNNPHLAESEKDIYIWMLIALHTGAAHHSYLNCIIDSNKDISKIVLDNQAKNFFLSNFSGFIHTHYSNVELNSDLCENIWKKFKLYSVPGGTKWEELKESLISSLSEEDVIEVFLRTRNLLARLCLFDFQSAQKQEKGAQNIIKDDKAFFPFNPFTKRKERKYSDSNGNELYKLRSDVKKHFLDLIKNNPDAVFYTITAPTGLGKTEAMLSGAEQLLNQSLNFKKIVFSVPQVSLSEQIYSDYFHDAKNVQIWNYLTHERRRENETTSIKKREESNTDNNFLISLAENPFSESYNITTFNQVLLAMCHPKRTRCIRSLPLRDSVIIMDEFHKLSASVLPYFLKIAEYYAKAFNCKFILGSATPVNISDFVNISSCAEMRNISHIYESPVINKRRKYVTRSRLTIDQVGDLIEEFYSDPENEEKNLLVVLNLVGKGTWQLFKRFCNTYNPWKQLEYLKDNKDSKRKVIFLDGLIPPILRKEIILECKKRMQRGLPLTLITTQMVEVGVDLDFDHGIIDYQGIAATIQRAGRVGREGRSKPCTVEVFSLITDTEPEQKTSFEILFDVYKKECKLKSIEILEAIYKKEKRFFDRKWKKDMEFLDSELTGKLLKIYEEILSKNQDSIDVLISDLFGARVYNAELGLDLLQSQYIAELYGESYQKEIIVLPQDKESASRKKYEEYINLKDEERKEKLKEIQEFVVQHLIHISYNMEEELCSMGLCKCKPIEYGDDSIPCYIVEFEPDTGIVI